MRGSAPIARPPSPSVEQHGSDTGVSWFLRSGHLITPGVMGPGRSEREVLGAERRFLLPTLKNRDWNTQRPRRRDMGLGGGGLREGEEGSGAWGAGLSAGAEGTPGFREQGPSGRGGGSWASGNTVQGLGRRDTGPGGGGLRGGAEGLGLWEARFKRHDSHGSPLVLTAPTRNAEVCGVESF